MDNTAVFSEEEYIGFLETYAGEQLLRNMNPRDYINGMQRAFGHRSGGE